MRAKVRRPLRRWRCRRRRRSSRRRRQSSGRRPSKETSALAGHASGRRCPEQQQHHRQQQHQQQLQGTATPWCKNTNRQCASTSTRSSWWSRWVAFRVVFFSFAFRFFLSFRPTSKRSGRCLGQGRTPFLFCADAHPFAVPPCASSTTPSERRRLQRAQLFVKLSVKERDREKNSTQLPCHYQSKTTASQAGVVAVNFLSYFFWLSLVSLVPCSTLLGHGCRQVDGNSRLKTTRTTAGHNWYWSVAPKSAR